MTPAAGGLLGAPLPSGYSPADFAYLEPLAERRGPCDSLANAPAAWVAQARIEVAASSDYLRRQAHYEQLLAAVDLDGSD
jgi:hypothetical protein